MGRARVECKKTQTQTKPQSEPKQQQQQQKTCNLDESSHHV